MDMKKAFENAGKKIIGRGPEAKFSSEATKYEKDHSVSTEEAQKEIFMTRLQDLSNEMLTTGSIDLNSSEYRDFFAGMREIFDASDTEHFKSTADARRSSTTPMPRPTISFPEHKKMKKQYADAFPQPDVDLKNKRMPSNPEINLAMQDTKMIDDLINSVMSDPLVTSSADLRATVLANPALQEQFGEILLSKSAIDRMTNQIDSAVKFDDSVRKTKDTTKQVMGKPVTSAWSFIQKTGSVVLKGDLNAIAKHVLGSAAIGTAKTLSGAAQLGWAGTKTSMAFLNKTLRK